MRIVSAITWGFLGAIAGALNVMAFGWVLGWPLTQSALIGAVLAGGAGLIYGFFRRGKKASPRPGQVDSRFNLERCAWCKGTGVEGKNSAACSVCLGQSSLLVQYPLHMCPNCKGHGRVFLGRRRCKVCRGAGWENYAHLDGVSIKRGRRGRTRVTL